MVDDITKLFVAEREKIKGTAAINETAAIKTDLVEADSKQRKENASAARVKEDRSKTVIRS